MKLLHTADFHLDSPFEALDDAKAAQRRNEQRKLLFTIAEIAAKEKVDVVLLCGDLLDADNSYYETQEQFVEFLKELGVPTFISPGNHDFYSEISPYARIDFPNNVCIFTKNELEYVDLDYLKLRVYGGAYIDKDEPEFLNGFKVKETDGYINIMCIHGMPSEENIKTSGLDYLALGHIHKESGLKKVGSTYYSYPGCPMGRGFDETGDKTISIVTIEDNECYLKEIPIDGRRYEIVKIDITKSDDYAQTVLDHVPYDSNENIYRIILTGEVDSEIDVDSLYSQLKENFYYLQLFDNTRQKKDLWEKVGENSLRGLFLSKLKEQYDNTKSEKEKSLIVQAVRWGLAAIDNMEEISIHENK